MGNEKNRISPETRESAKSRGLRDCVVCVGPWVQYFLFLRGSLRGSNIFCFCVGLCVGSKFFRGSFVVFFWYVGQLLCTRRDYLL